MIYLDNDQFQEKFSELWSLCSIELFKLEIQQEYDEFNIEDWSKISIREANNLAKKAQSEIYAAKDQYKEKINDGLSISRIRLVKFPLTLYSIVEFSGYAASKSLGVDVRILEEFFYNKISKNLLPFVSDFLLFDNKFLLKADNQNGLTKCPFYFSEDQNEIEPFIHLKNEIQTLSIDLDEYLKMLNFKFNSVSPDGHNDT